MNDPQDLHTALPLDCAEHFDHFGEVNQMVRAEIEAAAVEEAIKSERRVVYSNNPGWVLYDLITNTQYGCGQFFDESQENNYNLYAIAQYCDELVPSEAAE